MQSSGRTLQANFTCLGKTFYFRAYGPGEVGVKSTGESGSAVSLFVPASGANTLNDEFYASGERDEATFREWKVNDINTTDYFSDRNIEYLNDAFYNQYADGITFYAIFEGVKPSNNIIVENIYIDVWNLTIRISSSQTLASNLSIQIKIDGEMNTTINDGWYDSPGTRPIQEFESTQILGSGEKSWRIKIPIINGGGGSIEDTGISFLNNTISLASNTDNNYSHYLSRKCQVKVN